MACEDDRSRVTASPESHFRSAEPKQKLLKNARILTFIELAAIISSKNSRITPKKMPRRAVIAEEGNTIGHDWPRRR